MPGPVFVEGEDVNLQVVEEDDLPFLQRVVNAPEVWPFLRRANPATMEDERTFYEEALHADDNTTLLICAGDEAVGIVGMNHIDPTWGVAELGYFVDPDASGNGYATAGVGLMVEYAFGHRRLSKLTADVLASNLASQRVLEKNSFEQEGCLRDYAFLHGEREDLLVYGRTDHDA